MQRASRLLTNVHVTVPQRASVFDLVRVSVLIVSVGGLRELHDRLEGLSGGVGKLNLTEWGQAAKASAKPYDLRPGLPSSEAASAQPLLAEAVA